MKEVKAVYTDTELRGMSQGERTHVENYHSMVGSGVGGIVLLVILYQFLVSAKYFFLEVPFIEPLYFITSPIWCIPLLFLSRSIVFKSLLALYVSASLPVFSNLAKPIH
jgi:Zn-dependent protease with chaperone function